MHILKLLLLILCSKTPPPLSFTSSSRTASTDFCLHRFFWATLMLLLILIFSLFFVSGPCARLSWPSRQLLSARKSTVSYRIVKGNFEVCPAHWKALGVSTAALFVAKKNINNCGDGDTVAAGCNAPNWLVSHWKIRPLLCSVLSKFFYHWLKFYVTETGLCNILLKCVQFTLNNSN